MVAFAVDLWRPTPFLDGVGAPYFSYDQIAPPELIVVGQVSCLLVSLGIVLLVGLLGRRVGGDVAGAVAAWAAALLPALVARGAIVTVDGFATFFVLGASLAAATVRGPRDLGRLAIAGACCGLALVSKYPAGLVGLAVAVTLVLAPWSPAQRLRGVTVAAAAGVLAAIGVMPALVLQPHAVWEAILYQRWFYDSLELGSFWVQAFEFGEWDLPLPYPELGAVFAMLATAGAALMLASRTWFRLVAGWLLFGVVLVAVHASYSFQPFRNLLPLAALCCVPFGFLAGAIAHRLRRPRSVLVGGTALLAVFFFVPVRHYVTDRLALVDSRREAVDWIVANKPAGRVLVQREGAFVPSELARLGPRAQVVRGRDMAKVAPNGAPVVVLAHVVRADSQPVMDQQVMQWLQRRYRVAASFGETASGASMKGWKGNRMGSVRKVLQKGEGQGASVRFVG
jgi:4-amino-4-deoxy-L-arabinose transferase-like glycosyltransferase